MAVSRTVSVRPYRLLVLALTVALAAGLVAAYPRAAVSDEDGDDDADLPQLAFLARNDVAFDALAAGPVAGVFGAPLLLTPPSTLTSVATEQLQQLDPDLVVLAGGEAALSPQVEADVQALGFETRREAGAGRDETAARIAGLLQEFATGRPLLSEARVTDEVVPVNAAELGGASLADLQVSGSGGELLWAVVDSGGSLQRGSGAVDAQFETVGETYLVEFDRDVDQCSYTATVGSPFGGSEEASRISVSHTISGDEFVRVYIRDEDSDALQRGFHLHVAC